jgi:hypothetical protein
MPEAPGNLPESQYSSGKRTQGLWRPASVIDGNPPATAHLAVAQDAEALFQGMISSIRHTSARSEPPIKGGVEEFLPRSVFVVTSGLGNDQPVAFHLIDQSMFLIDPLRPPA